MKVLIFPFLILFSLFWHVFCFNESKNETLHQKCPDLPAGQLTYLFWEAESKAHVVIPSLDLIPAYYGSNCTSTHTVETLGKHGVCYTPQNQLQQTRTHRHMQTSCLCTRAWGPLGKDETGNRLQPLEQLTCIWMRSMMNCSSSSRLVASFPLNSSSIAFLLPHDRLTKDEGEP